MVAHGKVDEGIQKVAEGLRKIEAAGDNLAFHVSWYPAVSTYLAAHRFPDGKALIERAVAEIERSGFRLFEPDIHRLKGEFLVMADGPKTEAESAFREAIAIARQRQAKSFELRAATSLARLLGQEGRRDEARTTLAEIYNWFTEGFDLPDLKDAKVLLDELGYQRN